MQMWRSVAVTAMVAVLGLTAAGACGAQSSAAPDGAWQLTWSDEFDQADGSAPSAARWVHDVGGDGWGNNELQTYTDRRENSFIRGGALVIKAAKESFAGVDGIRREYTSARLKTLGTFAQAYGRFEARIRIPRGQGIWPAFWMLGDNVSTAGWPTCGEIDIMENVGREPNVVHGTLHGPGYSGGQGLGAAFTDPAGRPFADDFHVFGIEWEPSAIRWYVDGARYATRAASDLPAGTRWVFDHPFFVLLNLAVGGNWPGNPDASTVLPQELVVDWVRVYKR
jgi:beta-glucanase (GH16 family)